MRVVFLLFFTFFISKGFNNNSIASSYFDFQKEVKDDFNGYNNKTRETGRFVSGDEFDFSGTLEANYLNFAEDRYKNGDYVDAYYFKKKAMKIGNYKIISPANPYSFGILPEDMEQFVLAREQLRNVSINSIINSNDGLILADSYLAYDCWLEAFEEGNSQDRVQRCRNRFLDNMKAMRISLLAKGYNVFDMTSKESLALNGRAVNCATCKYYSEGQYCNSIYFTPEEIKMNDKTNIVLKRIQRKVSYFSASTITILYYPNAYGFDKKLSTSRLNAIKNLIYNSLIHDEPVKPIVGLSAIKLPKNKTKDKIYRDAITICVGGNE